MGRADVWFHLLGGGVAGICSLSRAPFGGHRDGAVFSVDLRGTEDINRCGAWVRRAHCTQRPQWPGGAEAPKLDWLRSLPGCASPPLPGAGLETRWACVLFGRRGSTRLSRARGWMGGWEVTGVRGLTDQDSANEGILLVLTVS